MKLYEFEAMQTLLGPFRVPVPEFLVLPVDDPQSEEQIHRFFQKHPECVLKSQVLVGKRGKAGGVLTADRADSALAAYRQLCRKAIWGELPRAIMICERLDIEKELYVSITYSPSHRSPALALSLLGGVEIESQSPEDLHVFEIPPESELLPFQVREWLLRIGFDIPELLRPLSEVIARLYRTFWENEARLLEINPLAIVRDRQTGKRKLVAADAVVILDDDASYPPTKRFSPRGSMGRPPTERELAAAEIDAGDHRGKAGSYIELDGDIAMMTFGGGGSTVIAETAFQLGLKPANLTDIGGNPPAEKMRRISRIILSKPGLRAVLVCGGTSSNTRIDVTLGEGLVQAIDELCQEGVLSRDLIWLVRRGGPEQEKGLRLLYECWLRNGIRGHIYDSSLPLTEAPQILKQLLDSQETSPIPVTSRGTSA